MNTSHKIDAACRLEAGKGDCDCVWLKSGERDDTVHLSKGPWEQTEDRRDGVPGQCPERTCTWKEKITQRCGCEKGQNQRTLVHYPVTWRELIPHASDPRITFHVTTEPSSIESIRDFRNAATEPSPNRSIRDFGTHTHVTTKPSSREPIRDFRNAQTNRRRAQGDHLLSQLVLHYGCTGKRKNVECQPARTHKDQQLKYAQHEDPRKVNRE